MKRNEKKLEKDGYLMLRTTPELKEKVRAAAQKKGVSMSALCVMYISKSIENEELASSVFNSEFMTKIVSTLTPEQIKAFKK